MFLFVAFELFHLYLEVKHVRFSLVLEAKDLGADVLGLEVFEYVID